MDTNTHRALLARYDVLAADTSASLSCGGAADLADVRPGEVCADLGCGRGRDVVALARRVGAEGHVYGLDASPAMIDAAARRAHEADVSHVTLRVSSLEALALPDASVDWVVSNCALNHARDKALAWREIARVLRPGGRFVVSDIYAVEPIDARHRDDPTAVAECWAGAETRGEYLTHVADAGLDAVSVLGVRAPYVKCEATLASFTLTGRRPNVAR